ncbi:glycoside hydrolase domain-containing protein [Gottschalkia acidurici 9a]|uniref:Glycoside hydrolase domain-containing protein n=1 Tax=Gottschalkia acidurici (strain ATCC 7906 / DSM 604 / BCRC 14475 / CIP 104303 / KCTC 5404 / NCIMB 10678 / 9a) TaxID=1128398 RepID=K0AYZ0_GOTA9|nr:hypothetical protein [Gottschalkia acidurici]AFS78474.1 glycoside hydrolase domain-containing protein [Gottschalkia acidurici 9a]
MNKENFMEIKTTPEVEVRKEKVDVKNATYEEISNVLNKISREQGVDGLRFDFDKTHFIESMKQFLNSPRNPNPNMKLVVEGNPMFEGYGGVKSNWIELYERKPINN